MTGDAVDVDGVPESRVIDGRKLWQKRLDEIVDGGHTSGNVGNFFIGDESDPDALQEDRDESDFSIDDQPEDRVTVNFYLLRHWRKMYVALGILNKKTAGHLERKATLHGHSIILHNMGADAIKEFKGIISRILINDLSTHEKLEQVNCNIKLQCCEGDRTSCSLSEKENAMIGLVAAVLCIPRDKYITVCQCYSLATHPDLAGFLPDIQENIKKFEGRQKVRRDTI